MLPMLATKGDHVPGRGAETGLWVHEVKWDGVRILADATRGRRSTPATCRLTTRTGNDVTVAWPDVARPPGRDMLVDGEVIALGPDGRPSFGAISERLHTRSSLTAARLANSTPATFMVFDLLRLDGRDLTALPWRERRDALEALDLAESGWQVPPTYPDGEALLAATAEQGLEGIVSKRVTARYEAGARSRHWLKFAHRSRASVVVLGWRPQEGTDQRLGALLVGEPTQTGFRYCGRVGSGIAASGARALTAALGGLASTEQAFVGEVPRADATGAFWVRPEVVVEVESLGRSRGGRLRQPTYKGIRADLVPADLDLVEPERADDEAR